MGITKLSSMYQPIKEHHNEIGNYKFEVENAEIKIKGNILIM